MRDTVGCLLCLHSVTTHQMAWRWAEEIRCVWVCDCLRTCVQVCHRAQNRIDCAWPRCLTEIKKWVDHCHQTTNAAKHTQTHTHTFIYIYIYPYSMLTSQIRNHNPFLYLSPSLFAWKIAMSEKAQTCYGWLLIGQIWSLCCQISLRVNQEAREKESRGRNRPFWYTCTLTGSSKNMAVSNLTKPNVIVLCVWLHVFRHL